MNGYVQDYVQDERYASGAGSAGAVPLSFALGLATCMGAEVAQYLSSGLAVNTYMYARSRHPCRSRS